MSSDRPSPLRRPLPKTRQKKPEDSPASPQHPHETVASVAEYIAQMSAELAILADGARLDTLSYLLHLAQIEAESHVPELSQPSS